MLRKFLFVAVLAFSSVYSEEFVVKVSEDEGKAISEIVTTLGKTNLVALGFKKGHLKALGQGLRGIGSLNFLGFILINEELKGHMRTIRKSSFKWDGFMDGLKPGFERELKSNKLVEDLPAFAALAKVDPQQLLVKAEAHNWDEFVAILIEPQDKK